jgi:hypothetical protein
MGIRHLATMLALLGMGAGLTGCGISATVDPVAAAASRTQDAGGAKVTMAIEVVDGDSRRTFTIAGNGVLDGDEGELTIDVSKVLEAVGAADALGGELDLRYLQEDGDTVLYVDFPALSATLPSGRRWIRLDVDKAAKSVGADLDKMMTQANQNPAEILDMLRATGQVEKVGTETIDGAETTKYKVAVDLAKAAELRGISSDLVERLTSAGAPTRLPAEVWVGDDGLVRQFRVAEDLSARLHSGSVRITVGLRDFGTDVSVTAPRADEVFDATGLAALVGQRLRTTTGP